MRARLSSAVEFVLALAVVAGLLFADAVGLGAGARCGHVDEPGAAAWGPGRRRTGRSSTRWEHRPGRGRRDMVRCSIVWSPSDAMGR